MRTSFLFVFLALLALAGLFTLSEASRVPKRARSELVTLGKKAVSKVVKIESEDLRQDCVCAGKDCHCCTHVDLKQGSLGRLLESNNGSLLMRTDPRVLTSIDPFVSVKGELCVNLTYIP